MLNVSDFRLHMLFHIRISISYIPFPLLYFLLRYLSHYPSDFMLSRLGWYDHFAYIPHRSS